MTARTALLPALALSAFPALFLASDKPAVRDPEPPDPFRPGPQHALIQKLVGTWDAVLIVKDDKGADVRTRGRLTTAAVAGFHSSDSFEGDFLGMKLVGHGLNGYCAARKQFFRFWTDSMTSSPMTLYGDYDAARRELTMRGECFGRSGKLEPCRTVTRFRDDDHVEWTLFGAGPDGKEMQVLRIEYTRKN